MNRKVWHTLTWQNLPPISLSLFHPFFALFFCALSRRVNYTLGQHQSSVPLWEHSPWHWHALMRCRVASPKVLNDKLLGQRSGLVDFHFHVISCNCIPIMAFEMKWSALQLWNVTFSSDNILVCIQDLFCLLEITYSGELNCTANTFLKWFTHTKLLLLTRKFQNRHHTFTYSTF